MAFRDFTKADWTVVRTLLHLEGRIDRAALAKAAGLSAATLSAVVNGLDARGLIERRRTADGVGRPAETVALISERPLIVGAQMADGRLDLALTGLDGRLRRRRGHKVSPHADWEAAFLIRKTIREWARSGERLAWIIHGFIAVQMERGPAWTGFEETKRLKTFAENIARTPDWPVEVMTLHSAVAGYLSWHKGTLMPQPCLSVLLGPEIEARILDGGKERSVSPRAGGDIPPGDLRISKQLLSAGLVDEDLDSRQLEQAASILNLAEERISDWVARATAHGAPGPVASIVLGGANGKQVDRLIKRVGDDTPRELAGAWRRPGSEAWP